MAYNFYKQLNKIAKIVISSVFHLLNAMWKIASNSSIYSNKSVKSGTQFSNVPNACQHAVYITNNYNKH